MTLSILIGFGEWEDEEEFPLGRPTKRCICTNLYIQFFLIGSFHALLIDYTFFLLTGNYLLIGYYNSGIIPNVLIQSGIR
jgi:hypothetical protein